MSPLISRTARQLMLLAVFLGVAGCGSAPNTTPPANATASGAAPTPGPAAIGKGVLSASPNRIVGRIVAVDAERGFAFVNLVGDAPPGALTVGAELITRTLELRETGHLRASSYVRGKTLGTRILSGQPSPGDEVVWRAP